MESCAWGEEYFCQNGQARPFSGKGQRLVMKEQRKYQREKYYIQRKGPVRRESFRSFMDHKGQYG